MVEAHRRLGIYLHLARASQMRMQPMVRDKLLVLAGVQAETMGLAPISALCRFKVLAHNRQHMIRDWPTLEAALADERFQTYLKQLERRYSHEKSEHMLNSLGIELGRERELYASDLEYAAALMDTEPESIDDILLQDPTHVREDQLRWRRMRGGASGSAGGKELPRASRMRQTVIVWGPFVVGLSILALAAALSRTLGL